MSYGATGRLPATAASFFTATNISKTALEKVEEGIKCHADQGGGRLGSQNHHCPGPHTLTSVCRLRCHAVPRRTAASSMDAVDKDRWTLRSTISKNYFPLFAKQDLAIPTVAIQIHHVAKPQIGMTCWAWGLGAEEEKASSGTSSVGIKHTGGGWHERGLCWDRIQNLLKKHIMGGVRTRWKT
uniref:Uncharacterized protein n=1 Tax=Oryza meridionalis TaxID=40149 RepID=A0A0E0EFQ4_9ORYZ